MEKIFSIFMVFIVGILSLNTPLLEAVIIDLKDYVNDRPIQRIHLIGSTFFYPDQKTHR